MSTYLWVNILSISLPLLFSFEPRFAFYKKFWALFSAIILVGTFFILWDVWYTEMNVWGFNPMHLQGIYLFNLPIEELMFFVAIPFACLFTYEVMFYFFPNDILKKYANIVAIILAILFLVVAAFSMQKLYTFAAFGLTGVVLLINVFLIKAKYLGHFFFSFVLILIPFFIVNGVLTGMWIPEEVVFYDDTQNLGIRLFTIPIEDSVYALLMLLMNTNVFEYLLQKSGRPFPRY